MNDQAEKLAAANPVRQPNRGYFQPGDRRINREGRPRGSKVISPAESLPADCARHADRLMKFSLPGPELAWRLTQLNGFQLVNLPVDFQIVDTRFDAATERVIFVIRSRKFPRIARGAPIPEFKLAFHGLIDRRNRAWQPMAT